MHAKQLIKKMLNVNPTQRITARDILKDPWIVSNVSPGAGEHATEDPLETAHKNLAQHQTLRKFKRAVRVRRACLSAAVCRPSRFAL